MNDAESSTRGAKEWLREKDGGVRIIAAEMAEYAGRVNVLWALALEALESDPDGALSKLVDIEILLENHLPLEVDDLLTVVREGSERLAAELPGDGDDRSPDKPPHADQVGETDRQGT